jgi:hypothetical protein
MSTKQFIAFFLYWLVHIPFTLLRPYQMRWIFTLKMVTVVPACFGLFIFCMVNTKGNIGGGLPGAPASKSTSFAWFVVYAFNSGLGNTVSRYPMNLSHGTAPETPLTSFERQTSSRINLTSAAGPNTSMLPCGRS